MSICHIEQLSVGKYRSGQMSLEQLSCEQLACEQSSFEQMSCEILIGMFRNMRVSKCPSGQLSDYVWYDIPTNVYHMSDAGSTFTNIMACIVLIR